MSMITKNTQNASRGMNDGVGMNMQEVSAVPVDERKEKKSFSTLLRQFGKRNWIIVGAVLLIGVAVWLNWNFFRDGLTPTGYAGYDTSGGMAGEKTDSGKSTDSTADYFATVEVSRKRARDESMEVLQNVLGNADATEAVKNEALAEMNVIAGEIEKEANIEALLISKGFDDCVAVMNGNSINVVVKSAGDLQNAQIAQINSVVFEQTGIEPLNVTIVHKN